jgi:hypothetical protein
MAEELGEESCEMMPTDAGQPWDQRLTDDDGNSFMFRSTERKIAKPSALQDEKRVLDDAFRANDAWLPSWSHFPWQKSPAAEKLEFAGAFIVQMPEGGDDDDDEADDEI